MGLALNAITSVSGFAPGVRAEPSAAVGSMEDFVIAKRALRASWGAIAAMTGVSEHVLRRSFDRSYDPPPGLDRPKPAPAASVARPGGEGTVSSAVTTADVVRLLARGSAGHEAICAATGGTARAVSDILGNGKRRGIFSIAHGRGGQADQWALTATGRLHRAASSGRAVSKLDLLRALTAGPLTVAELTEATGGRGGIVATYIATLRAQDLVAAALDGANGRLRHSLTQAGRKKLAEASANG